MTWAGKLLGGLIGLLTTHTVWGALLGASMGHLLDQNWSAGRSAGSGSISELFFKTTFEVFGHVAKSDGRVSEAEIDAARGLMRELNLGANEVAMAINCFRVGKASNYDLQGRLSRLRRGCGARVDLLGAFMELQLRASLAGNGLSPPARAVLIRVAGELGIAARYFDHLEATLKSRTSYASHAAKSSQSRLADSYQELEVEPNISDKELTRAYRRQMSRHHPDKLVANGLPESMAQFAKEKTQRIQEAYETLRAARGMQ